MSRPRVVARASWRALRHPGAESAVLSAIEGGWRLSGKADIRFPEGPTTFRYRIDCNRRWDPRTAALTVRTGSELRRVEILQDERHEWTVGGFRNPELRGCTDLDFNASPATNTLALNRLALAVGETAEILTAYVMFPDILPIAARQRYTRLDDRRYRFEGLHNDFARDFDVDEKNVVITYPLGWERVTAPRPPRGRSSRAGSGSRKSGRVNP
jgi:uncharacterized protein